MKVWWICALVVTLALPVAAQGLSGEEGAEVGLGFEFRDGNGVTSILHSSGYPNLGFHMFVNRFYMEMESPLPILLPDVIISFIKFLSRAKNDNIPLWYLLNGDTEPGYMSFLNLAAAVRFPQGPGLWLETGLLNRTGFRSVFFGDERVTIVPANFAGTVGLMLAPGDRWSLRATAMTGNNFTEYSSWNPFYGFLAKSNVALTDGFGLELRFWTSRERLDFRKREEIQALDWVTFWGVETRLVLHFDM